MPSIPANAYPKEITFDSRFSQKDQNLYRAMVTLTAYHNWQKFQHLDLWRTPYTVKVDIGQGEGLAHTDHVNVRLPQDPGFWSLAGLGTQVGHEFGHMNYGRLLFIDLPEYGWGASRGRGHINAIHHADGLYKFYHDGTYVESHWKVDWKKRRMMRIAVFDVEKLMRDEEKVLAHVAAHRHEKQWDYF